jgi:dCTP diphosphatase
VGDDWGEIQDRLARFRDDRDWRQFHTLKDLAAAIAIEAAELQELFLWKPIEEEPELIETSREAVENELADVVIQSLNFASVAGVDLVAAINRKIDKNEGRYPADAVRGSSGKAPAE